MLRQLNHLLPLTKHHLKPTASLLARSFHDQPLWIHLLPNEIERMRKLRYIFEFLVRDALRYGESYAISSQLEGVALWLPSEKTDMSLWRQIQSGAIPILLNLGLQCSLQQQAILNFVSDLHKELAPFPHFYLSVVGVKPELQGQGYCSHLLKPMFTRLDKEGLPCYLETHLEKNIPMYEYYGFTVLKEAVLPTSSIKHWSMLRKPQPY